MRFLVARLHTLLQLGNLDYDMLWGMRLVACDLVHGDVWKIRFAGSKNGTGKEPDHEGGRGSKMAKGRAKQRDAVRASPESWEGTGEEYHFIGTTGEPIPPTRSDWAAYLLSPSPGRLIDHVKTKDGAPYDRRKGIDAGLAERVVLANCALNR